MQTFCLSSSMPSPPSPHSLSTHLSIPSDQHSRLPETSGPESIDSNIARKNNEDLIRELIPLEELNRRNASLEDKRYSTSSPYYKGLTDFSLVINRERLPPVSSLETVPSPPMPRSLSEPNIPETNLSLPHPIVLPSSDQSRPATLAGIYWPEDIHYIARKKNSDLLQERIPLEEFNRGNASLEDKRYSTSSPYYKGLTDFSLVINRGRLPPVSGPDRVPSPRIPCSLSEPKIPETRLSLPHSNVPPSDQSRSTSSAGVSWPEDIDNIIAKKKNLELLQERLEELDRKSATLEDKRYSTSSPYYKGLTDFSLVINRERLPPLGSSPERVPSPPIPRSLSEPNIPETHHSYPNVPPPDQSRPATSPGTSSPQKSSNIIRRKKSSDLTHERLEEFNRNNAILDGKRYSTSSPYYKGLTDFTLVINREKLPFMSSPGRESLAASSVSSSSRSSFIVKMQDWSNCFLVNKRPQHERSVSSSSSSSFRTREAREITTKDIYLERKDLNSTGLLNNEKPLRERVSEPSSAPPPSPPPSLSPPQTSPAKKVVLNAKETCETENDRKFIWADKYRPDSLKDFICNRNKAIELRDVAKPENSCHFIFEGLPGVGKRTMIWALLREAFGADKVQAREKCKEFDLKGEAVSSIHVNVKESSQHVEVNLSELRGYEKHVIVELIKETNNRISNKALRCSQDNCRAIILYEADKLSTDALLYIRWLLDRYKGCNKVFFCCNDVSRLQPIKSLCNVVQLLPPSNEEIVEVLEFIAKQEGIELPHQVAEKIANNSKNNLRQAIRSFEATWQSNSSFKEDQVILTGWEDDIAKIAKNVVEEQSPKQLYNIRGKLQKLIEHNVSPEFIFKTLVVELKNHLDEKFYMLIDSLFEEYNKNDDSKKHFAFTRNRNEDTSRRQNDPVKKNVQHFMRIEEFIAKFMSCYRVAL